MMNEVYEVLNCLAFSDGVWYGACFFKGFVMVLQSWYHITASV